jgi:hypothetical protein
MDTTISERKMMRFFKKFIHQIPALFGQKVNCLLYYTYIGLIYVHIIRDIFDGFVLPYPYLLVLRIFRYR